MWCFWHTQYLIISFYHFVFYFIFIFIFNIFIFIFIFFLHFFLSPLSSLFLHFSPTPLTFSFSSCTSSHTLTSPHSPYSLPFFFFSCSLPYSQVANFPLLPSPPPHFFPQHYSPHSTHSRLPHLGFPIFFFIFSSQSSISSHTPPLSLLPPFFFCYFIFLLLLPFFSSNLFPFSSSTKPHFQRRTTRENFLIPSSPIFLSFLHFFLLFIFFSLFLFYFLFPRKDINCRREYHWSDWWLPPLLSHSLTFPSYPFSIIITIFFFIFLNLILIVIVVKIEFVHLCLFVCLMFELC